MTGVGMTLGGEAAGFPDDGTVGDVVAAGAVGGGDDGLELAADGDDEGRAPGGALVAGLAPFLGAGGFVEADDEGAGFVVPGDDEHVAGEGGRGAFAERAAGGHVAEVLFPDEGAVEGVAVEAAGAEGGPEMATVGDG